MIEAEERIPQATVWLASAEGGQKIATGDYFAGRKILLFGLPGAFTPTCSEIHLPGYIAKAPELRAAGVDAIACLAVNETDVPAQAAKCFDGLFPGLRAEITSKDEIKNRNETRALVRWIDQHWFPTPGGGHAWPDAEEP